MTLTHLIALGEVEAIDVLHRDISFNNVMLDDTGKAVVNDWDYAGKARTEPGAPIKTSRIVRSAITRCLSQLTFVAGDMAVHVHRNASGSFQVAYIFGRH